MRSHYGDDCDEGFGDVVIGGDGSDGSNGSNGFDGEAMIMVLAVIMAM